MKWTITPSQIWSYCVAVTLFFSLVPSTSAATNIEGKRVFVVHSYQPRFKWTYEIQQGIEDELVKAGVPKKNINVFYMDTKSRSDEYVKEMAHKAFQDIQQYQPDVVILSDDAALKFLGQLLLQTPNIPVSFCGINGSPIEYGVAVSYEHPQKNFTGVIERHSIAYNLKLAKKIVPTATQAIAFFDADISADAVRRYLIHELESELGRNALWESGIQLKQIVNNQSWENWKKVMLENQNSNTVFFFYSYYSLRDHDGKLFSQYKLVDWLHQHSRVAEFGGAGWHVEGGLLASYATSGAIQGRSAARIALRLLHGENVGNIAIKLPPEFEVAVNLNRAKHLGIEVPLDILAIARVFSK